MGAKTIAWYACWVEREKEHRSYRWDHSHNKKTDGNIARSSQRVYFASNPAQVRECPAYKMAGVFNLLISLAEFPNSSDLLLDPVKDEYITLDFGNKLDIFCSNPTQFGSTQKNNKILGTIFTGPFSLET